LQEARLLKLAEKNLRQNRLQAEITLMGPENGQQEFFEYRESLLPGMFQA
jgi:hypothetical protein